MASALVLEQAKQSQIKSPISVCDGGRDSVPIGNRHNKPLDQKVLPLPLSWLVEYLKKPSLKMFPVVAKCSNHEFETIEYNKTKTEYKNILSDRI
ncbi:hypothetical protein CEXT_444171 [Caerostris extrusa]|uniref:Uncharacterized protein n=1 Tax=Caerostris extrusa TaxID=172846 RepID=A0AAV4P2Z7_CAEEX|nr:hypothetical protein CEXT_444171 [Caerostris extrusa]